MHLESRRRLLRRLFQSVSLLCFVVAIWGATGEIAPASFSDFSGREVIALAAGFAAVRLRRRAAEGTRLINQVTREAFRNAATAGVTVAVCALLFDAQLIMGRAFLVSFTGWMAFLELVTGHGLQFLMVLLRRDGRNLRHAVLVGSGPRAARLLETIQARPEYGYYVEGYVDDDHDHMVIEAKRLGTLKDLESILENGRVDEVFLCLPIRSAYDEMQNAIFRCEERGIPVHVMADMYAAAIARATSHDVGAVPVLSMVSSGPMAGVPYMIKKVVDRVGAALILAALAPLIGVLALAIFATMGRPIFYSQVRVGRQRRTFRLHKFRTMVPDAEARMAELEEQNEMDGPVFKLRDDPRVTPLGQILRRYSVDELPQLWNVLKGEMSLVGPRPLPLRDVDLFDEAWLNRRFAVMPGLTCTWQVSGRNDVSFAEWIRMDLEYVDNWSLAKDFGLLIRTLPAVLKKGGAY